jgi:hypothetical protein
MKPGGILAAADANEFPHLPYRGLLDPQAAHDAAMAVQDAVDVTEFTVDGVNIWILARLFLFMQSPLKANALFQALHGAPSFSGRLFDSKDSPDYDHKLSTTYFRDADAPLLAPADFDSDAMRGGLLFVETPGDYTQYIDGYAVNIIVDPVLRHFRQAGERVVKYCRYQRLLPEKRKLEPPVYFGLGASGLARLQSGLRAIRKMVHAVNGWLASHGIHARMSTQAVERDVAILLSSRSAARIWLRQLQPELLFTLNFSNLEKMGVIAAAKELGLPVVDLMHGILERRTIYHDYPDPAAGDILPFPDSIWVWGDVTQRILRDAMQRKGARWSHVAKSGLPWRNIQRARPLNPGRDHLRQLVPAGRKTVLYCHDPGLHDDEFEGFLPRTVLDAIRSSADTLFWLVRLHPRSAHLKDAVSLWLSGLSMRNVELDLSSDLQIDDVFALSDCVVVKYTTVALEAASAGLPVITYHAVGAATFADYISSGHIHYAPNAATLVQLAREALPAATPFDYVDFDPSLMDSALASTRSHFATRGKSQTR